MGERRKEELGRRVSYEGLWAGPKGRGEDVARSEDGSGARYIIYPRERVLTPAQLDFEVSHLGKG